MKHSAILIAAKWPRVKKSAYADSPQAQRSPWEPAFGMLGMGTRAGGFGGRRPLAAISIAWVGAEQQALELGQRRLRAA